LRDARPGSQIDLAPAAAVSESPELRLDPEIHGCRMNATAYLPVNDEIGSWYPGARSA
jgi:hypothetical protein